MMSEKEPSGVMDVEGQRGELDFSEYDPSAESVTEWGCNPPQMTEHMLGFRGSHIPKLPYGKAQRKHDLTCFPAHWGVCLLNRYGFPKNKMLEDWKKKHEKE